MNKSGRKRIPLVYIIFIFTGAYIIPFFVYLGLHSFFERKQGQQGSIIQKGLPNIPQEKVVALKRYINSENVYVRRATAKEVWSLCHAVEGISNVSFLHEMIPREIELIKRCLEDEDMYVRGMGAEAAYFVIRSAKKVNYNEEKINVLAGPLVEVVEKESYYPFFPYTIPFYPYSTLRIDDYYRFQGILRTLKEIREPVTPKLMKLQNHRDKHVRWRATQALEFKSVPAP